MAVRYLVPDGKHLPVSGEDGKPDHHLMGAAWAALHGGYRGNKYEGPDKEKAIGELRRLYHSEGMSPPGETETKSSEHRSQITDHNSLTCRAAVKLPPNAVETNEIVYLPEGLHEITPIEGGIGKPIKVLVDQQAAVETEKRRMAIIASGKKPYFDLNHDDREASFWPNKFFYRPGEGVIAAGEFSGSGKRGAGEKDFWAFSPIFNVDNKFADPARVTFRDGARPKPNMGGLVNDPAFKDLPLWAKNAGAPSGAAASSAATVAVATGQPTQQTTGEQIDRKSVV